MKTFRKSLISCSDEELMIMVSERNSDALEELYNRYHKNILYYFYKMLGGAENKAQDFLHDIFLKIIEKPYLFDQKKKFKTWIYQIAYNKCKNEYRREQIRNQAKTKYELKEFYTIQTANPENKIDSELLNQLINNELSGFSKVHYNTFILRFQHQLSIKEIAEIEDCPIGTVKSRLYTVTKKIAKKVKDKYQI